MLEMINVSAGYGERQIIKNISFSIKPGEIIALIGLNGSGKSTLLKTALGLLKISAGKILLNQKSLHEMSLFERAKNISLLESQPRVSFSITVKELVELSTRLSDATFLKRSLLAVGMDHMGDADLLEISSGEAQRVFIAHTLASNAPCILFDEPFSHLDWSHKNQLIDSLKKWRKEHNTTFVLAVHELEQAIQIADRIAVINMGQILDFGSPEKVFTSGTVLETFAFRAAIDENPFDGSKRLTLGRNYGK